MRKLIAFLTALGMAVFVLAPSAVAAGVTVGKLGQVLLLSSYSEELTWQQELANGIGEALNIRSGIAVRQYPLNVLRVADETLMEHMALDDMEFALSQKTPDGIIISDDEALAFFLHHRDLILGARENVPMVICGLNQPEGLETLALENKATVIREWISGEETLKMMLKLFPGTKHVYVINDYTLTGREWQKTIAKQLDAYESQIKIEYNDDLTIDALITKVHGFDESTLVLSGFYFVDGDGSFYYQAEFQQMLSYYAKVPIFGLMDSSQGYGQFGGKYTNAYAQGEAAGRSMLQKLSDPDNALDSGVIEAWDQNQWIFDYDVLAKYHLLNSPLPSDAQILNMPKRQTYLDPVMTLALMVCLAVAVILAQLTFRLKKRNKQLIEADASLRASQGHVEELMNRFEQMIETAPLAFSLVVDDRLVEHNQYYEDHVAHDTEQKMSDKLGVDYLSDLLDQCRKQKYVTNVPRLVKGPQGQMQHFQYSLALSEYQGKEAFVMWGANVEELEQSRKDLLNAYEDMVRLIKSAPLPIAMVEPSTNTFVFANTAWLKLFEIPATVNMDGYIWPEGGSFTAKDLTQTLQQALSQEEPLETEWPFLTYSGNPLDVILNLKRVTFNGRNCLLVTHRDLREEKRREKMLTNAALQEWEANQLKSKFLMLMSHELKTPMNAMLGLAQLAKQERSPERGHAIAGQIEDTAHTAMSIVNNMLDFSLLESGEMQLEFRPYSFKRALNDVMAMAGKQAAKKQITIETDIKVVHDMIVVDLPHFEQVLHSLLSNAIKFSHRGSSVRLEARENTPWKGRAHYTFKVIDHGIGISPKRLETIFTPFVNADKGYDRAFGGLGMELSIAKRIIEQVSGEMIVESREGEGSTFGFHVQLAYENTGDGENRAADVSLKGKRGLVVDDIDMNREIMIQLLEHYGIVCQEAENGRDAIEKLFAAKPGSFDFVLMDIQMPEMNGLDATRAIRDAESRPDLKAIPVIAITANALPEDIQAIREAGCDDYVAKPVYVDKVVRAIGTLV